MFAIVGDVLVNFSMGVQKLSSDTCYFLRWGSSLSGIPSGCSVPAAPTISCNARLMGFRPPFFGIPMTYATVIYRFYIPFSFDSLIHWSIDFLAKKQQNCINFRAFSFTSSFNFNGRCYKNIIEKSLWRKQFVWIIILPSLQFSF